MVRSVVGSILHGVDPLSLSDRSFMVDPLSYFSFHPIGARCSSVVRAITHGAIGRRIDPSWSGPIEFVGSILHGGPIELFLVPSNRSEM